MWDLCTKLWTVLSHKNYEEVIFLSSSLARMLSGGVFLIINCYLIKSISYFRVIWDALLQDLKQQTDYIECQIHHCLFLASFQITV